jgi:methylmalonyl-CoA mutase
MKHFESTKSSSKLYGIFKTIESVSGKVPVINGIDDASVYSAKSKMKIIF